MITEIPINHFYYPRAVIPGHLRDFLRADQWNLIVDAVNCSQNEATCVVCFGEWACCLLFSFPCIFCFHPCFDSAMERSLLQRYRCYYTNALYTVPILIIYSDSCCTRTRKLRDVNAIAFSGLPVLTYSGHDSVLINTDLLDELNCISPIYASAAVVEPGVVNATVVPVTVGDDTGLRKR